MARVRYVKPSTYHQKIVWLHQTFKQKSVFCWLCITVLHKWGHAIIRLLNEEELATHLSSSLEVQCLDKDRH